MTTSAAAGGLPDARLAAYFESRRQMRDGERNAVLRGLTKRERQLVKEAAVMGYVRGTMAQSKDIPDDSEVLALVIDCCLGFSDLNGESDKVDWQFVTRDNVPAGPWLNTVTTSQVQ